MVKGQGQAAQVFVQMLSTQSSSDSFVSSSFLQVDIISKVYLILSDIMMSTCHILYSIDLLLLSVWH